MKKKQVGGFVFTLAFSLFALCAQAEDFTSDMAQEFSGNIENFEDGSFASEVLPDDDNVLPWETQAKMQDMPALGPEVSDGTAFEAQTIPSVSSQGRTGGLLSLAPASQTLPIPQEDFQSAAAPVALRDESRDRAAIQDAGAAMRPPMLARQETVVVTLTCENYWDGETLYWELLKAAFAPTGNGQEGDYLQYHTASAGAGLEIQYVESVFYQYTYTFFFTYYTSFEEEAQTTAILQDIYRDLDLEHCSDYETILRAYDYITNHVSYDYDHLNQPDYPVQFSAYGALTTQKAVCQGFAQLLYRILWDQGIENRLLTGQDHMWNLVCLGGRYYHCDATWDAETDSHREFLLKSETIFQGNPQHIRSGECAAQSFLLRYPSSAADYNPAAPLPTLIPTPTPLPLAATHRQTAVQGTLVQELTSEEASFISQDPTESQGIGKSNSQDKTASSLKLNRETATLKVGSSLTLLATGKPQSIKLYWISSNAKVASVSQTGKVTGVKKGTARIAAVTADGKQKASCQVTVKKISVKKVKLSRKNLSLKKGKTKTLSVSFTPRNATNQKVIWTSSNPAVVSVTKKGKITAKKKGKATITVTSKEGKKTASCKVVVKG